MDSGYVESVESTYVFSQLMLHKIYNENQYSAVIKFCDNKIDKWKILVINLQFFSHPAMIF